MAKITMVPAASFKARCLELMDRVRETRETYIVTKHGKPVAKLVPYEDAPARPFLGSMAGTVLKYERPFDPIDGEWDIDAILNPPSRVPKRRPRKRR